MSVETEVPIVTYSFTLFGFSQSISYPDFSRRHVNAVDVTGIVPGREDGSVITTHATSLKCKQNELEEKRRAQQEANTRDAGVGASGRAQRGFHKLQNKPRRNPRSAPGRSRRQRINAYRTQDPLGWASMLSSVQRKQSRTR